LAFVGFMPFSAAFLHALRAADSSPGAALCSLCGSSNDEAPRTTSAWPLAAGASKRSTPSLPCFLGALGHVVGAAALACCGRAGLCVTRGSTRATPSRASPQAGGRPRPTPPHPLAARRCPLRALCIAATLSVGAAGPLGPGCWPWLGEGARFPCRRNFPLVTGISGCVLQLSS
jgi:hypothetical protein